MKTETPRDLFFDQLLDLFSVENQLKSSLPTLANRAENGQLASLLLSHLGETERHPETVSRLLTRHGYKPGVDTSKAMEGLISGGDAHLDNMDVTTTRGLMIIAHCLQIEHYEVAACTITPTLAQQLGFAEEAMVLKNILQQERGAADTLTRLQPTLYDIATNISPEYKGAVQ